MCLQCDVTKKNREDVSVPPREGAHIHGLYMEGARWDTQVRDSFIDFFVRLTVAGVENSWFKHVFSRDIDLETAHFDSQARYTEILPTASDDGW